MPTLNVTPSRRLRWAYLALHGLVAVAIGLADIPPSWRLALYAGLFIHLLSRRLPRAVRLQCQADGMLSLWVKDDWQAVDLLAETYVSPWLTVLRYRQEGQRWPRSLPILSDSLPPDDFRRLRVWLKWKAVTAERVRKSEGREAGGTQG